MQLAFLNNCNNVLFAHVNRGEIRAFLFPNFNTDGSHTGNSYHPTANAMSPTGPRPHAAPSGQSSWRAHVDGAISLNPDEAGTTHDLTKRLPVCLAQSRSAIGASVRALWEDLKPWNVWRPCRLRPSRPSHRQNLTSPAKKVPLACRSSKCTG